MTLHVEAATGPVLAQRAARLRLPLWVPWPLPVGWAVTGVGWDGDAGQRATVLGCRGPNPVGGEAELFLVAEEPGTGVGSRYAGLPEPNPGPEVGRGWPHARVGVQGHQVSLWCVGDAAPDRAVYVGETGGRWLWLVLHPASAGVLLAERLAIDDVRELGREVELLPYDQPSSRLRPA